MTLIERIKQKESVSFGEPYHWTEASYVFDCQTMIGYERAINDIIEMPIIKVLSSVLTDEQLDQLEAIQELSGVLNALTPEQKQMFKDAISRRD